MSATVPLPRLRLAHLLAMAALYFCAGAFLMHFPRIVLQQGGSAQDAGWLLALGLIPSLLLAGHIGEWNRRVGGRWPSALGGLLAATSNFAMIWVDQVGPAMLAARMGFAVGHALMFSTLFAQAVMLVDDPVQRAKIIGWLAVVIQLGNALGSVLGEAAYHAGSTVFWLACAGIGMLAALLGACWPDQSAPPDTSPGVLHTVAPLSGTGTLPAPRAWPAEVWSTVAVGMAFAAVTQFLPAFIDHLVAAGSEPFAAGWYLTPAFLVVALVRLGGGFFAARLLRPAVLGACHAVLLLTLLLTPWISGPMHALWLGLAFGASYGWLYPALTALAINRAAPAMRGRVSGWLVAAFEFGFRLGPIGLGALITQVGYRAMFIVLALAYILILCAARLAARRAPQPATIAA